MHVLLVNPQYPDTFWGFKYALKFIAKKAPHPPLGLLTVAGLLPTNWELRLVDMNVTPLTDAALRWADYLFLGAISIQRPAAEAVIARAKAAGVTIVAGGPLFTVDFDEFPAVDHFVLNEAEVTMPRFLDDLRDGRLQRCYTSTDWADLRTTPLPRWDLIDPRHYATMSLQFSRGCPFDCEFCDITTLYGRTPRTKETTQVIAELEALYQRGWRGGLFFVDDNFIGNKHKVKREILPALITWMRAHRYPFNFITEASINLADDRELMTLMAQAGFHGVFIGIESPHEASLTECHKLQNTERDLLASVHAILAQGMQVMGGFIVGFDHDPLSIFDGLIEFIQQSGIVTAMVGLLNAPRGTKLYQRLQQEGRLIDCKVFSGDNTDSSINFIPRMNHEALLAGYQRIIATIYAPQPFYARVKQLLRHYRPSATPTYQRLTPQLIGALLKSVFLLGMCSVERRYYWRLLCWTLFTRPRLLPLALSLPVFGYHFRRNFEERLEISRRQV